MIEQKPVEHYLKAWREHRGMTQHQLAGPAGTTKHTVSRIEHGRTGLDDDMLRAFGRVLNCRPGDILNSAPDDASEIQPLWDRLDNASKDLFRQLVELKVSALEKPTRVESGLDATSVRSAGQRGSGPCSPYDRPRAWRCEVGPTQMIEQKLVGHFLKAWRKHRGLTQEQLAERVGVTHGLISQLETGRTGYSQPLLEAAASALNCRPGDLINASPDDPGSIEPLWDRLDDGWKEVFRQLIELTVQGPRRPPVVESQKGST